MLFGSEQVDHVIGTHRPQFRLPSRHWLAVVWLPSRRLIAEVTKAHVARDLGIS